MSTRSIPTTPITSSGDLAHRVQRPQEKINHALFLGGSPGIGKDTLLAPVKTAVGPWNFQEVSPKTMLGSFNGFAKSVILRVSEARDLGDVNRYSFYDATKTYAAAPPDVLRVNEKNLREYYVTNVLRRHHHQQLQIGRPVSASGRPAALCGVERSDHGRLRGRLLELAVGLVRQRRRGRRRRLSGRARHLRLRPESTASRRPRPSGPSSMPTGHPKKPNWPTPSTSWDGPTR